MKIPILTYRSCVADGQAYASDHHIALASDLRTIARLGMVVVPLEHIVDALLCDHLHELDNCVGLSFEQGSRIDVEDFSLETGGDCKSFLNILRASAPGEFLHATSFVIASGEVMKFPGLSPRETAWWSANWWKTADRSGLIKVESGGWSRSPGAITDLKAAQQQIGQATKHIEFVMGPGYCRLFAYPDGQANDFLHKEYFPGHYADHRIKAAFTMEAKPVSAGDSRWMLPRFVCGRDWSSPGEFRSVLL